MRHVGQHTCVAAEHRILVTNLQRIINHRIIITELDPNPLADGMIGPRVKGSSHRSGSVSCCKIHVKAVYRKSAVEVTKDRRYPLWGDLLKVDQCVDLLAFDVVINQGPSKHKMFLYKRQLI